MAITAKILQQEILEPFLWLATIKTDLNTLYIVNNNVNIISNNQEFIAWAFDLTLATDDGETLPTFVITIDNIDRIITETIRKQPTPPRITLELVTADTPDIIEFTFQDLTLRNVQYDVQKIQGTLESNNSLMTNYPKSSYDPTQYPGLFNPTTS